MLKKILCLLTLFVAIQNINAQTDSLILYYNLANYKQVIKKANELISAEKTNYDTYYYRGLSQQALYKYNEAVESFLMAKAQSNGKQDIDLVLAKAWEKAGNDDKAMQLYHTIYETDSLNIQAIARMGAIYKSKKEYVKAVDYYSQLVHLDSLNGYFYSQLAYCVSKIGLKEAAADYYFTAYKINTNDFGSVKGYLGELVKMKNYELANIYIDSFLYAFPDNLYLLKQRAFLEAIGGNYLDAVHSFKKISELGDSTMFTCKYYGQSLYNNGNYDQAVFWLDRYLQKYPDDVKNQFIISLAYQKDYQYQNSLDHFDMVADIIYDKENIAQLFKERANTYMAIADYNGFRDSTGVKKKENYDLALECFLKAEELYPKDYTIYKDLGVFYDYKLHNTQIALYYYQIYYNKIDPKKINEHQLIWIQDKLGKLKEEIHFMGND